MNKELEAMFLMGQVDKFYRSMEKINTIVYFCIETGRNKKIH